MEIKKPLGSYSQDPDFAARAKALAIAQHGHAFSARQLSQAGDDIRAEERRRARAAGGASPRNPELPPSSDPGLGDEEDEDEDEDGDDDDGEGRQATTPCTNCDGDGFMPGGSKCKVCDGTGRVLAEPEQDEEQEKPKRQKSAAERAQRGRVDVTAMTYDQLAAATRAGRVTWKAQGAELRRRRGLAARRKPYVRMTTAERRYHFDHVTRAAFDESIKFQHGGRS